MSEIPPAAPKAFSPHTIIGKGADLKLLSGHVELQTSQGSVTRKVPNSHGSCVDQRLHQRANARVMWPIVWTAVRTYAPYITFPVAFVVGAVGYHLEWFIRGTPKPREEEKGVLELREERKLQEQVGMDSTQVLSLKEKLEFTPKAALNRNRPEKS